MAEAHEELTQRLHQIEGETSKQLAKLTKHEQEGLMLEAEEVSEQKKLHEQEFEASEVQLTFSIFRISFDFCVVQVYYLLAEGKFNLMNEERTR